MLKVLTIYGTRPEAIKLAPVLAELKRRSDIQSYVCVTGQHRQMLDQVSKVFDIVPDLDLDLMCPDQGLSDLTARVIAQVDRVIAKIAPDLIMVQGDTTTAMASALAAFYNRIPLAHVEAGLRSGDIDSPFPEEVNRRVIGLFARYHFAPTERTRQTLLAEGVPDSAIYLTGNPVIDALHAILRKPCPPSAKSLLARIGMNGRSGSKKLILVTAHRRENFGRRIEDICLGLKSLARRHTEVIILYPVHLNPNVKKPVLQILGDTPRIFLVEPVEYDVMAHVMNAAYLILTDSGGIQEEAPALGKPVLVMRTETERPEGIEAGTARLVGPNAESIVAETERLLADETAYRRMACSVNPYGDGQAAKRIAQVISSIRRSVRHGVTGATHG
jgi:UDP-N-acetylglucosamine 2-epimerase (non-hydrolysing)